MNREERRAIARARRRRVGRFEVVARHCERCGAPYCPVCDDEMAACPDCGGYHCEGCGYWLGWPVGPAYEMGLS